MGGGGEGGQLTTVGADVMAATTTLTPPLSKALSRTVALEKMPDESLPAIPAASPDVTRITAVISTEPALMVSSTAELSTAASVAITFLMALLVASS